MRNFLAVILAIIAGLTTVFGLVSWKISDVIHQPEPIQDILGSGESADELKAAVPGALGNLTAQTTGIEAVDAALQDAVTEASGQLVADEGFDEAWSESLELTRSGWLEELNALGDQLNSGETIPENSTAAQLDLRLDPVAQLAVSNATEALPDMPGVDTSEVTSDLEVTVPTSIPPISALTAEQVVMVEELMTLWPAMLGLATILFIMALVVASRGSRWIVWLVTGVMVALGGALVKIGYTVMQHQLRDQVQEPGVSTVLRPLLRAIQDWADPQLIVLMVAGVGVALLGILGGFISANRRR